MKQAFARFNDETDYLSVDYYKEYARTNLIEGKINYEEMDYDYDNDVNNSINWDLYDKYKYTFKKYNDTYYFESFELKK